MSWRRIPGSTANTTSYTVTGLTNNREYRFAVRARSSAGHGGRSNVVTATPQQPRSSSRSSSGGGGGGVSYLPPSFTEGAAITREVAENSRAGTRVGGPVTATEARGRQITYSKAGADAALFDVASQTGQILLARGVELDFEKGRRTYTIDIVARSIVGATARTTITINVTNVDEPGVVTLSPSGTAETGAVITAALSDPDGSVAGQAWQWQRSADGVIWTDIPGAISGTYTPVSEDARLFLRAVVTYTDVLGVGLTAQDTTALVQARPGPVATTPVPPTAQPLPTLAPTPPGTVAAMPTPMPPLPTAQTIRVPTPMPTKMPVRIVPAVEAPTSTPVTVSTSPKPTPSAPPTSTPVTAAMAAPEPTVAATKPQPEQVVPVEGGGFPVWLMVLLGLFAVVALAAVGLMVRRARRSW